MRAFGQADCRAEDWGAPLRPRPPQLEAGCDDEIFLCVALRSSQSRSRSGYEGADQKRQGSQQCRGRGGFSCLVGSLLRGGLSVVDTLQHSIHAGACIGFGETGPRRDDGGKIGLVLIWNLPCGSAIEEDAGDFLRCRSIVGCR